MLTKSGCLVNSLFVEQCFLQVTALHGQVPNSSASYLKHYFNHVNIIFNRTSGSSSLGGRTHLLLCSSDKYLNTGLSTYNSVFLSASSFWQCTSDYPCLILFTNKQILANSTNNPKPPPIYLQCKGRTHGSLTPKANLTVPGTVSPGFSLSYFWLIDIWSIQWYFFHPYIAQLRTTV